MRLFITTLSMFSVIAFGYALAGYGGGLFGGEYRGAYIGWGLALGFAFAGVALWLWNVHKDEFFVEGTEPRGRRPDARGGPGQGAGPGRLGGEPARQGGLTARGPKGGGKDHLLRVLPQGEPALHNGRAGAWAPRAKKSRSGGIMR